MSVIKLLVFLFKRDGADALLYEHLTAAENIKDSAWNDVDLWENVYKAEKGIKTHKINDFSSIIEFSDVN